MSRDIYQLITVVQQVYDSYTKEECKYDRWKKSLKISKRWSDTDTVVFQISNLHGF